MVKDKAINNDHKKFSLYFFSTFTAKKWRADAEMINVTNIPAHVDKLKIIKTFSHVGTSFAFGTHHVKSSFDDNLIGKK